MSTVISIVSYPFLPAKLGGQKGIALFYKYFSRHCRLVCITTKRNDPAAAEGYTVTNSISDHPLRYVNIFLFFSISHLIKNKQASHFILEHPYYGWLGMLLKRSTRAKMVLHAHNIEYTRWKSLGKSWWPLLKWYEKTTMRKADYIFFKTDQDRDHATTAFGLNASKSTVITYGIEWNQVPPREEISRCQSSVRQIHGIPADATVFLFNGSLDYLPNLQAVKTILEKLNPVLLKSTLCYKILICGKGLPAGMNELNDYADKNIIYAGFVDDIGVYFKGADVFINPVTDGGGIKTKLVEALGYSLNAISTVSGAVGVPASVTGDKLTVLEDNDWQGFAEAMLNRQLPAVMPSAFFKHFYWGNIALKAHHFIEPQ